LGNHIGEGDSVQGIVGLGFHKVFG
jgi:hypothetical protein